MMPLQAVPLQAAGCRLVVGRAVGGASQVMVGKAVSGAGQV